MGRGFAMGPDMQRWGEPIVLPLVRRLGASDLPVVLEPLTLLHLSSGELRLRGIGGGHRLQAGEALALRGRASAELDVVKGDVEALVLQAPPAWADRARSLLGIEAPNGSQAEIARATAGSELARRSGRLLLTAHLERSEPARAGASEGGVGIVQAGRLIELVGVAHAITGSIDAPRKPVGARNRSRRAGLVRALEDLESASLDGLSLRVLAERLEVSERQASRLLREELGTSFPDYVAQLRIERAKKLLATTDDPVTEVALETGWQSISHFNAVFRRRVGITPTGYRAQSIDDRGSRYHP